MAHETMPKPGEDLEIFQPSPTHDALRADLHDLEVIANPATPQAIEKLRERLAEVREHVLAHFRSEEDGGWFAHIERMQPRLCKAVQDLVEEHARLREALERLWEACCQANCIDSSIREPLRAFIATMRSHESREDDLIQEAYNRDIGPGD